MTPKKWELLSKKDVSPHAWFPIEMRTYRLPDGRVVDDFSVSTLADVAMIVAITKDKKVLLVNQFKPGANDVILEFPAGRMEHHSSLLEVAVRELHEEVGVDVEASRLKHFLKMNGFTTKGTETVHVYFVSGVEINSQQSLDENEDIEVVKLTFTEMDEYVFSNKIWSAQTIAAWEMAKKHFPSEFIY